MLLVILIILSVFTYRFIEGLNEVNYHYPDITPRLERTDGNYSITVADIKYGIPGPSYLNYYIIDQNQDIIQTGSLVDEYEKDPRFHYENFSRYLTNVIYHDKDSDWHLTQGDSIILPSKSNSGIAEAGQIFALQHISQKKGEYFFEIELHDDIPDRDPPRNLHYENNFFVLENSSSNDDNVTIVTNHVAFSHYKVGNLWHTNNVGITLLNNCETEVNNISLIFEDMYQNKREKLVNEMMFQDNITIQAHSSIRVVFNYKFPYYGNHQVVATISGEIMNCSIQASANILIVMYSCE